MKGRDVFRIWAPAGAKWTDWVRPVPFVAIDYGFKLYEYCDFSIPNVSYISKVINDTAIIVDLPGYESIKEGIALAKVGYRPIPIYNGTIEQKGAIATVDNHAAIFGLVKGAELLKEIVIDINASPVFLLDTNRKNRFKMDVSVFDNSWDIYSQDMPTAEYFLKNGINKIIVRGDSIEKDLKKILYKFQQKGISILFTDGYEIPKKITIKKTKKDKK